MFVVKSFSWLWCMWRARPVSWATTWFLWLSPPEACGIGHLEAAMPAGEDEMTIGKPVFHGGADA
jgi:hypothetical protein